MIELVAVMVVFGAYFGIGVLVCRIQVRSLHRRDLPILGPAFTALMIGGIAACAHGHPYAQGGGATLLAVVLGVCLLVSARSVRVASLIASWVLPIVWLVGAATRIEHCKCETPQEPLTRPTEHFGTVVFVLFAGSLVIYLLARRPVQQQLPRVRILDR